MIKDITHRRGSLVLTLVVLVLLAAQAPRQVLGQQPAFRVEETSINDIHAAIRSGQLTCQNLVQAYIDRARAYNGVCTALVTKDGVPIPQANGSVRAGSLLKYPTQTVAASTVLPNLDQYAGPPIEFGRMEQTISDPTVQQQFGMRVGISNAGQLNAFETLNIRGERSVTCKGDFDRAPSAGPLPPGAPAVCEEFRKQPDAIERAIELDKRYGRNPDLRALPLYCVPMSLKNWYDAKDIRSTGGNDVNYAMDVPKEDSPDIADIRAKGAVVFGVNTAASTGLTTDGPAEEKSVLPGGNYAYAVWGGQACNPYDTERVPRGTSAGSGVAVAANLVTCAICEQGAASCKGPASRNNIVNVLTTRGIMTHGGMNSRRVGDRSGIMCRTVRDAAQVLDAVKGYQSQDMYTAIPKQLIPAEPYASFVVDPRRVNSKPLAGMRIGIVREFMVKHSKNDVAISDQLDKEIKTVLRDKLGAELVESVDPLYPDDPSVPNMKYTFQSAFAEIIAHNIPEFFWQTVGNGELEFAVPNWDVRTVDYAIALARGEAPLSPRVNLRRMASRLDNFKSPFTVNKYLKDRGDARITDWKTFVANAKWEDDGQRAASENAVNMQDMRTRSGTLSYTIMQAVMRLVVLKVMYENNIDLFVNPENTLPPPKIGGPAEPAVSNRGQDSCCSTFTALLGSPEIEVPAGYTQIIYEPQFALSADKRRYVSVAGTVESKLPHPMPISLMFWAGPGTEPALLKAASAYEAATHHRVPPPMFGPLQPQRREATGAQQ
jgi:amidase